MGGKFNFNSFIVEANSILRQYSYAVPTTSSNVNINTEAHIIVVYTQSGELYDSYDSFVS